MKKLRIFLLASLMVIMIPVTVSANESVTTDVENDEVEVIELENENSVEPLATKWRYMKNINGALATNSYSVEEDLFVPGTRFKVDIQAVSSNNCYTIKLYNHYTDKLIKSHRTCGNKTLIFNVEQAARVDLLWGNATSYDSNMYLTLYQGS